MPDTQANIEIIPYTAITHDVHMEELLMMNQMTVEQIAEANHLTEEKMHQILDDCGVQAENGALRVKEVMEVMQYLQSCGSIGEWKAKEYLERMIGRYTPFVDTCSLLRPEFPQLLEHMEPLLLANEKKLMIPSGVENELKHLLLKNDELRSRVADLLVLLDEKERAGIVMVCGSSASTFADQQMLTIATSARVSDQVLFITQDNSLSEDILRMNDRTSVRGNAVAVCRVNRYGYLSRYRTLEDTVQVA